MAEAQVIVRVLDQASQALNQIRASSQNLERTTSGLKNTVGGLQNTMSGAVKALGGLAIAAGAAIGVDQLKSAFINTAQAAAEAQRSANLFAFYMKELGQDTEKATGIVQGLTREFGIVPSQAQEAIQILVKQGASLEQVAQVLPAVAASASAAGADVNAALVQAARGIAMSRSELVEYAGITSNFGPVQKEFASSIKKKVDALTEEEKITANINAVLKESQIELKAYRATSDPAIRASNDLAAAQKNLSIAIGQFTLPYLIKFQTEATNVVKTLTNWVQSEHAKKLFQEAQPYLKQLGELFSALGTLLATAWNNVLKPVLAAIAPALSSVLTAANNIVKALTALLKGDLKGAGDAVLAAFKAIASGVVQVLNNLAPQMRQLAANLIEGMRAGIADGTRKVVDAVVNLGQSAIDAAKRVLKIRSPSQEFYYLGFLVVDGFTKGILDRIEEQESKLIARFGKVSKDIQDALAQIDLDIVNANWDRWVYSQQQKAEAWAKAWQEKADLVQQRLSGATAAVDEQFPNPGAFSPQLQMLGPTLNLPTPSLQPLTTAPTPLLPALSVPAVAFDVPFQELQFPELSPVLEPLEREVQPAAEALARFKAELEKLTGATTQASEPVTIGGELPEAPAIRDFNSELAALLGPFAGLVNLMPNLLGPLQAFGDLLQRLNPIASLVAGAMQVLQPAIEAMMQPLVELGGILAQFITPIFQALAPIIRIVAQVLGGFALVVAKAWNALAWIIEKITFGALKLFIDDKAIEESLKRMSDNSNQAADGLKRLSNSVNLVSGYGFTGVAMAVAPVVQVTVNVNGVLDPVKTTTSINTYNTMQTGLWDRI